MEYTSSLLVGFIDDLDVLDKEIKKVQSKASRQITDWISEGRNEWSTVRSRLDQTMTNHFSKLSGSLDSRKKEVKNLYASDIARKKDQFDTLKKCKEILILIECCESNIENRDEYERLGSGHDYQYSYSTTDLLSGNIDFVGMSDTVDTFLHSTKKKDTEEICAKFFSLCRYAESTLSGEIDRIRASLIANLDSLMDGSESIGSNYQADIVKKWNSAMEEIDQMAIRFAQQSTTSKKGAAVLIHSTQSREQAELEELTQRFCSKYPPKEFADEYKRLYALEPSYTNYMCAKEMPRNVHLASLECDITACGLSGYTKSFLNRYYYFMYRGDKICIPYCASFGPEFNYLFRFDGEGRAEVVKHACDLGMRLFMMLPPGKIDFTFVDPVTLGESFAMFTRLVDVDDRTSEIINGKIWSSPSDIEEKLKIMTDHISNVTQRCLQGKFDNIYEYNRVAEQNAEAYQVLMLMDYPAGLTDQSLKLLEQIVTSGPKCGVFTIIFRNESQFKKISDRAYPLVSNIETSFQRFDYSDNCTKICCSDSVAQDKPILWHGISLPRQTQTDIIIATLKKGIKNAEKVVVGIEKVSDAETTFSTRNGIRIPIGVRGANDVQYLTLGVGGSHHALVAGITRSGKSSLLHTIILQALSQYRSPDELSLYLVDFKRGVEFQIYADFVLPVFKVVAIETEREFGYNILVALEREQQKRAVLFKRAHVDKIEEYRELPESSNKIKMPRVLVIMDEFHELFQYTGDEIGKKSSELLERIVRQGAAFGIHLILSSQSYSNINGIDKAVFDQMAVRIVLKCSKADANMLLDNGSTEIDQISIDDPGRAVYNSEAGNKEYNSHFRVAYIDPSKHRGMLQEISNDTCKYADPDKPTRILLSNIEDNSYSIFNQFANYTEEHCKIPGRLYIGESLTIENNLHVELARTRYANMLIVGSESEPARSMFAFTILSLAINYWVSHGKNHPSEPFIYLLNYKPLRDSFFEDMPKELAANLLTKYVVNVPVADYDAVKDTVSYFHSVAVGNCLSPKETDKYLMIFGYQRAEDLKSSEKEGKDDNILSMMSSQVNTISYSMKEMIETILMEGSQQGTHVIMWQDDFKSMDDANRKLMTYFYHRIAYGMSKEDFSKFVGVNDVSQLGKNTAVYSNRTDDTMNFRPYQSPDKSWVASICEKLQ